MKNFPTKVEWIAEHRNGDKCYYYPGTGWVSARDGLVTGFDTADVPEGATHVQITDGVVRYVKCVWRSGVVCVDVWRNGAWCTASTLQKLPGTVVCLADGDVQVPAASESSWIEAKDAMPPRASTRVAEFQLQNGEISKFRICDIVWSSAVDQLVRWRYAA